MKIINYIISFLLIISVSCKQEAPSSKVNLGDLDSLEADLRLVAIEATLNRRFSDVGAVILVRMPSSTHEFTDFDSDEDRKDFIYMLCQPNVGMGQLDVDTAKNFISSNQKSISLDIDDFGNVEWIRLIDERDYEAYWGEERSTKQGWEALLKDHPKVIGVIEISSFGWSDDRSEALIYVGGLTSSGVGHGNFYAFRRHGNQYSCESLQHAPSWMTKANKTLHPTRYRSL